MILLALSAICLFSCSIPRPVRTETADAGGGNRPAECSDSRDREDGGLAETGVASWYGVDFHGKATADGEIYDMNRLTAAHRTLPFHTLVEVENLENGASTVVRINDRGPFMKNRIIDLSLKAARRVGIEETGTAPVRLRIVLRGNAAGSASKPQVSGYCLQAGAFENSENARDLAERVRAGVKEIPVAVIVEGSLYKVVIGPFPSSESKKEAKAMLEALGLDGFDRECAGP